VALTELDPQDRYLQDSRDEAVSPLWDEQDQF
jgi:hypothetical protein